MTAPAVWPLPDLLDHLRGLHDLGANEAADRLAELTAEVAKLHDDIGPGVTGAELRDLVNRKRPAIFSTSDDLAADWVRLRDGNDRLAAQLAAVVAALDTYQTRATLGVELAHQQEFVSAIAKVFGR